MKILLVALLSLSILPIFAQESDGNLQNNTNVELKKLYTIIDELSMSVESNKKSLELIENQIGEIKLNILEEDRLTNEAIIALENNLNDNKLSVDKIIQQLQILNNTLSSHSNDSFSFSTFTTQLSQIQFYNSIMISAITTMSGILGGFYLGSLRERQKTRIELNNARNDIQNEFSRINQEVCNAIRDTRNVLTDLNQSIGIINRMISRQTTPHDELKIHLHGLKFVLWQFTVPHMRGFSHNEKDELSRLHDLVEQTSILLVTQHHTPLKQRLEELLRSGATNGVIATHMRDELIQNFVERMKIYGTLYRYLQILNIEWLTIPSFSETN